MPNRALAVALSTHPGPTIAVTAITVILGVGLRLEPDRLALLGAAMLANQASVGLSNDWIDADRDRAVGRRDKPIARGWISAEAIRTAAIASAVLALALAAPLGPGATTAQLITLAAAWSYNLRLKSSALSVLPYVVAFGVLPSLVTLSRDHPALAAPWATGVGALLGIAAHFANVLPDLDDDARTGVRGLPHRLPRRVSAIVAYGALLAAACLEFLGLGNPHAAFDAVALAAAVAISAGGILIASRATRWHFRLIIAAAVIDVGVLSLAGSRILG